MGVSRPVREYSALSLIGSWTSAGDGTYITSLEPQLLVSPRLRVRYGRRRTQPADRGSRHWSRQAMPVAAGGSQPSSRSAGPAAGELRARIDARPPSASSTSGSTMRSALRPRTSCRTMHHRHHGRVIDSDQGVAARQGAAYRDHPRSSARSGRTTRGRPGACAPLDHIEAALAAADPSPSPTP
jgi:hypothetical protein